jgi:D-alanyl-lipoteichoic acid acyltransferase DltB (MBOAT superfamily)
MQLASIEFLLFLAIASAIFYIFPIRFRWVWLLVLSLCFCAIVSLESLPILTSVVVISYFLGLSIESAGPKYQRIVFYSGLVFLVLILIAFKFTSLYGTLQRRLSFFLNRIPEDPISGVLLPMGLSFVIFTAMSYLLEIHYCRISAERNFGIFALYMLLFFKLTQGPIERPAPLIAQLRHRFVFDELAIVAGLKRILWGFFKKMFIADRLALYVNAVYGNASRHNGTSLLIAALFYSFQVYADFSGYTDIALGSAQIFNIRLSENFRRPYFAKSIREFWGRWHISFSSWLRDYLYLPLAYFLSRKLRHNHYLKIQTEHWIFSVSTLIAFLVCGLWHGKGLNYVLWGLLFGVYLVIGQLTRRWRNRLRIRLGLEAFDKRYTIVKIAVTFALVTIAWVFFRIPELSTIALVFKKILTRPGIPFGYAAPMMILFPVIGIISLLIFESRDEFYHGPLSLFRNKRLWVRLLSHAFLVIVILLFGVLDSGQFIYFQF